MINLTFLKYSKKSVTLMELVAIIIVMGIAVSTLMSFLGTTTQRVNFSENEVYASFAAEQLMESSVAQGFIGISDFSWFTLVWNVSGNWINQSSGNITAYVQSAANARDGFAKSVIVRYCNVSGNQWVITDNNSDPFKMVNVTVTKSGSKATLITIL